MRLWLVALIGVATILVVRAVAHQGNEPTLEEEEEEERLKMEEVTQSPPVTPPSRAGSGYDLTIFGFHFDQSMMENHFQG